MNVKMSPVARQLQSHIEKKSLDLKSIDAEGVAGALRVSVADVVRAQLELLEHGTGANETRGKSSATLREAWQGKNATATTVRGGLPQGAWRGSDKGGKGTFVSGKTASRSADKGGKGSFVSGKTSSRSADKGGRMAGRKTD